MSSKKKKSSEPTGRKGFVIDQEAGEFVLSQMIKYFQATIPRSMPDVRDGFKVVIRRILWAMYKMGMRHGQSARKNANIVGSVLPYHPHGDAAIEKALALLGQVFRFHNPYIDKVGFYGNVRGDRPSAARYIEAKISSFLQDVIYDDLKYTKSIDLVDTYDGRNKEPLILPTKIPILLLTGGNGISGAVYSNTTSPHNLVDVCNATIAVIRNPNISAHEIAKNLLPDFPTKGCVTNPEEIINTYSGRSGDNGRVKMRGKVRYDEKENVIIIYELPYTVSSDMVYKQIVSIAADKTKNIGINAVVDSSQKEQPNIILEVRKNAPIQTIIEMLYRKTSLSSNRTINMHASFGEYVVACKSIKSYITPWYEYRTSIVRRIIGEKITILYTKSHQLAVMIRIHTEMVMYKGKEVRMLDAVLAIIQDKSIGSVEAVHTKLITDFKFDILQAEYVTGLGIIKLSSFEGNSSIERYNEMQIELNSLMLSTDKESIDQYIIDEIEFIKNKHGRPRQTEVIFNADAQNDKAHITFDKTIICALGNNNMLNFIVYDETKGMKFGRNQRQLRIISSCKLHPTHRTFAVSNKGKLYEIKPDRLMLDAGEIDPLLMGLSLDEKEVFTKVFTIDQDNITGEQAELLLATEKGFVKRLSCKHIASTIPARGLKIIEIDFLSDVVKSAIFLKDPYNVPEPLMLNIFGKHNILYRYPLLENVPVIGKMGRGVMSLSKYSPFRNELPAITDVHISDGTMEDNLVIIVTQASRIKLLDLDKYDVKGRGQKHQVIGPYYGDDPLTAILPFSGRDVLGVFTGFNLYRSYTDNIKKNKTNKKIISDSNNLGVYSLVHL